MSAIRSPGDAYTQFGAVPSSWWGGALGGPSVQLADGRSLFLFGQTLVTQAQDGFGAPARPNSALLLDLHGVHLIPGQPIPDNEDGTHYGPIGAAALSNGTVLVCCEGLSDAEERVATAACILNVTDTGVAFDHWITGWPNATGDAATGAKAQVVYHAPVVVPAQGTQPETLVVFGTQYTPTGAVLQYATVPTDSIENYEQWVFATAAFGLPECDVTASAWYDAAGFHVASAQQGPFNRAVLYEALTLDGPWDRTLWVTFGGSDTGEERHRCYAHPQIYVGDQQVLWSVSRVWDTSVDPTMHRPYWGTGATIGLNVTLTRPLLISGKGVQPTGLGTLVVTGPGVTDMGDGTLLLSDTAGDDTPVTNNIGYTVAQQNAVVYQIAGASGSQLMLSQSGVATLQGFTVVTNPDGTATVYTPAAIG